MSIAVNYDRRQVAKPGVVSVAALMILSPRRGRQGARTTLDILYEAIQDIPPGCPVRARLVGLSVSGGSIPDGAFARIRAKP